MSSGPVARSKFTLEAKPNALVAAGFSGDYLDLAHDLVGIGSYVLNLRTRVLYMSREMALLLAAGDAAMQMPIEEYRSRFYAPENRGSTSAAADAAYDAGKPLWLDARVIRADGRPIWVRTASLLRTNDVGDPVRVGMLRDITEQREADDALAQNQEELRQQADSLKRLALVMEHANDAILMLSEQGRIIEANGRTIATYGYSLNELRQLTIADLRDPSTLTAIQSQLQAAGMPAGAVFETLHRRKDGSIFPVEVSARLVEIDGRRSRLSIVRDISQRKEHEAQLAQRTRELNLVNQQLLAEIAERKRTEAMLRASEEQYRSIVENAQEGIIAYDRNWFITFANARSEAIFGYERGELLGRPIIDIILDGDREAHAERRKRWERGHQGVYDGCYRRKDGTPVWLQVSGWTVFEHGKFAGLHTMVTDITARRQADQLRARMASIVESSEDAIISKTLDGVITSWNRGAEKLFGYAAEESVGTSMLVIFPSERADEEANILQRIARGETVECFETTRKKKSGEVVDVSVTVSPLRDSSGAVIGASTTARDISDRVRTDAINAARLHIIQYGASHSLDELLEETLNEAEKLTSSLIGFYHFVDADQQTLTLQNWSTRTKAEFCRAAGKGEHYPISQAGVWVDCVSVGGPVIHNDYASLPHRKGMPEGHARVTRELVVPVHRNGAVRAILGVGNKATDYVQKDVKALSLLADLAWEIAERKRADELLRASETRFRTLIESAPLAVGVSRGTRTIYVNRRYRELFRIPDSVDIIGRSFLELWAPESREMLEDYSQGRSRGESVPTDYEGVAVRADGERFPVHVAVTTVQLTDGLAAVAFFVDLTEIRQAEELYRAIFEGATEGIFRTTLAGNTLAANPTMASILGYDSPAQLIAEATDTAAVLWPSPDQRKSLLKELDVSGQVRNYECQLRRRDGTMIWALVSARRVDGADGCPLYYEGFLSDITEKKQLEEQFLRVQRLESIGMLAAGIAHDLNNVLAPIHMAVPLLSETRSDPFELEMLQMLQTSGERGAELVRQILGFAHGASGAAQVVQVKHVLRDVVQLVTQTFPKSIVLEHSISKDLWPAMANPTQIHQVLLNLCVNARDAMPAGGTLRLAASNETLTPEMAATMRGARPGNWLVLQVEDTGTGMSSEILARIFEPFFTTKGAGKGTGLGLPTVRGIVESHGGFMSVTTEPGRGTTFRVYLPPADSSIGAVATSTAVSVAHGAGERILFVEDEPSIREIARPTLVNAGYQVAMAENGAQAAEMFESQPDAFALVITDVDMPIVDGRTLARRVRAKRPETKILAVSGSEQRAAALGWQDFADGFVQKPYKTEQLLGAVHSLLSTAATQLNAACRSHPDASQFG